MRHHTRLAPTRKSPPPPPARGDCSLALVPPRLAAEISGLTPFQIRTAIMDGRIRTARKRGITYVYLDDALAEARRGLR
jgi:hypothetical protein